MHTEIIETAFEAHAALGGFVDVGTQKMSLINRIESLKIQIGQLEEELGGLVDMREVAEQEARKLLQVFPDWQSEKLTTWLRTAYPLPTKRAPQAASSSGDSGRLRRTKAELQEIEDQVWAHLEPDAGKTAKQLTQDSGLDQAEVTQALARLVRKEVVQRSGSGQTTLFCKV